MRKQRWFMRALWLAILAMTGAALAVANQAQPLAEPAVPSDRPQKAQDNRLPVRPSDPVSQPRTGTVPAAAASTITVSIGGGTVTATTSDPDVELTASKGGKLLKIADAKTGQLITINAQEFSIQQGEGANSLRAAFTL